MSIHGFIVDLSSHAYETPSCCSSCLGPQQTQVEARLSQKSGNVRTTLTMAFPYCDPCAKRARREKIRQGIVGVVAALLGVALAFAAWRVDVGVGASIRFALALPLAMVLTAALALVTRQSVPALPATARGEAVILRDTSGAVLCTNPQFAQRLAQANGATPRPGAQHLTVEVWSPLAALLCGVLVLISWIKVGAPQGTIGASTSPTTSAKVASAATPDLPQPAQPKKPAPAAIPPAKRH
jgi:hypothetical protein